jgi:hypothetical protein
MIKRVAFAVACTKGHGIGMRLYVDHSDNELERIKQQVADHVYQVLSNSRRPWRTYGLDHWETIVIPTPVNVEFGPFPRR